MIAILALGIYYIAPQLYTTLKGGFPWAKLGVPLVLGSKCVVPLGVCRVSATPAYVVNPSIALRWGVPRL